MASAELVGVLSMIQSTFESSGVQMEERRISLFRNLRRIFADLEMKERASRQEQITKVCDVYSVILFVFLFPFLCFYTIYKNNNFKSIGYRGVYW